MHGRTAPDDHIRARAARRLAPWLAVLGSVAIALLAYATTPDPWHPYGAQADAGWHQAGFDLRPLSYGP